MLALVVIVGYQGPSRLGMAEDVVNEEDTRKEADDTRKTNGALTGSHTVENLP